MNISKNNGLIAIFSALALGSTAAGCTMPADAVEADTLEANEPAEVTAPVLHQYDREQPAPEVTEECEWVQVATEPVTCETGFQRGLVAMSLEDDLLVETDIGDAVVEFSPSGLIVRGQVQGGLEIAGAQLYAGTSAAPILGDRVATELFPHQLVLEQPSQNFEFVVAYEDLPMACGADMKIVLHLDLNWDGEAGYEGWMLGNDNFGAGNGYFEYYENCCVEEPQYERVCETTIIEPETSDII